MVNIAIVDDDLNFTASIIRYLQQHEDIIIVGTATNEEQALNLLSENDIDILLLDINITGNNCDGILIADKIITIIKHPPKIIMVTSHNNQDIVNHSLMAGATCYILKSNFRALPDLIRNVHTNNLPEVSVLKNYAEWLKEKILKGEYFLSESEIKIYKMAEFGNSREKISESLAIAESTCKKHVGNILKKFKTKNLKMAFQKFRNSYYIKKVP